MRRRIKKRSFAERTRFSGDRARERQCRQPKVEDFHFHDLRHEAVSRIFETTDLSDTEIMTITGHTSQEMLKAYAKLRHNSLTARLNGKKRG